MSVERFMRDKKPVGKNPSVGPQNIPPSSGELGKVREFYQELVKKPKVRKLLDRLSKK